MKLKRKKIFWALLLASLLLSSHAYPQETTPDEQALFTTLASDALIVLDLSSSMNWTPVGEIMYTHHLNQCTSTTAAFYSNYEANNHDQACIISTGSVPKYANDNDTTCTGPFYRTSGSGHTKDCSRLGIAKRAIFDVLDDNDNNTIDRADEQNLNIRFGYMRFYGCSSDDTGGSYSSGCNMLIRGIGSKYSQIYCNSSSSCSASSSSSGSISGELASGSTPLVSALNEAKLYLDVHKAGDSAAACRQKFVILITDGADTLACGGSGDEDQPAQYKGRRETVAKAKALADSGYKVFVVGFGSDMPYWEKNTLNWAAYYGGTDNPLDSNTGDTGAYNPSAVTTCQADAANPIWDGIHYYAASNDPGEITLQGYAFLATSANDLSIDLKNAIQMIREATYSFSTPSVSSQRTLDENFLYEASFQPIDDDPFWKGHLKKYQINSDGSVGSELWDAGYVLQSTAAGTRNILTCKSGVLTAFSTSNITIADLYPESPSTPIEQRDKVVGYFRGESSYNPDSWKLGDIFHSNPVNIGTPNAYFWDMWDTGHGFETFRDAHQRTSANGSRMIIVGGNDGQFHAFRTLDGKETWSFIPPNFLPKLRNIAHTSHPTGLTHQYFVDGPVSAADVWQGTGDGRSKNGDDWKTYAIFGEGRGGGTTLWSSSSSCDSVFNPIYTSDYPYYCGYYAFDFTNPISPQYLWHITNITSAQAPYLGDPWSKVLMGRVIINGCEKWVGFFGAGYNAADCAGGGGCDPRGKGFFVVDLKDGSILWSYTRGNDSTMNYSLPSSPAIVDADSDGFIDTVYVGDLGGSLWRFKFCSASDGSCGVSSWSGGRVYEASTGEIRPIFTTPTVSKDKQYNIWVFWGTGDKTDPTAPNAQEKFYALKDNTRSGTYKINDLENITTGTYSDSPSKKGWYINMNGQGEKMLAEPTVFGGVLYFSTYTPPTGGDPCAQAGTATLYGVNYVTGGAALRALDDSGQPASPARSMTVGVGVPSAPVLSIKPAGGEGNQTKPDIYMTVSGGAGSSASTLQVPNDPPALPNRTNILFWKDMRVQ